MGLPSALLHTIFVFGGIPVGIHATVFKVRTQRPGYEIFVHAQSLPKLYVVASSFLLL